MVQTPEGRGERRRVDPKEKRTVKRVSNVRAPKTNFNICFGDCVTHTHFLLLESSSSSWQLKRERIFGEVLF